MRHPDYLCAGKVYRSRLPLVVGVAGVIAFLFHVMRKAQRESEMAPTVVETMVPATTESRTHAGILRWRGGKLLSCYETNPVSCEGL